MKHSLGPVYFPLWMKDSVTDTCILFSVTRKNRQMSIKAAQK